jgi:hypothetical protein
MNALAWFIALSFIAWVALPSLPDPIDDDERN